MRLRVLMTNGTRTVDLIWLEHNGTDIYYGGVGSHTKGSYHASGSRHSKSRGGNRDNIGKWYRLESFKGQIHLISFLVVSGIVESDVVSDYCGKKGDAVIWLDARTLPKQVNVGLGLLEVGAYNALLPLHQVADLRMVHIFTNTVPWIYVMVLGVDNL